ncbi:winged helix domain-containing protein [Bradyrhizobium sp. McL0616]|uniref:winged helix domain-containing protein n=1 Tax=Bradyrhizobium sp. McL0616 TaxID=3415674 RepID=UPI003CF0D4FA
MSSITIRLPSGSCLTFTGREAWTLRRLIEAGSRGVTTIDYPAPRWSHYIFKLRRAGLTISTEYEPHRGSFPGTHGRYRLETPVIVVAEAA